MFIEISSDTAGRTTVTNIVYGAPARIAKTLN